MAPASSATEPDTASVPAITAADRERVYSKIEPGAEHDLWMAAVSGSGQPVVYWQGRPTSARRVVWELDHDPLPRGGRMRSLCGVDLCLRLEHLEPHDTDWQRHPFEVALRAALKHAGLSRKEAARRAGVGGVTIMGWTREGHRPWRDQLQAVAEVLDAPELVELLPSQPRSNAASEIMHVALRRAGLTLEQAAAIAGLTSDQAQGWIVGRRNP